MSGTITNPQIISVYAAPIPSSYPAAGSDPNNPGFFCFQLPAANTPPTTAATSGTVTILVSGGSTISCVVTAGSDYLTVTAAGSATTGTSSLTLTFSNLPAAETTNCVQLTLTFTTSTGLQMSVPMQFGNNYSAQANGQNQTGVLATTTTTINLFNDYWLYFSPMPGIDPTNSVPRFAFSPVNSATVRSGKVIFVAPNGFQLGYTTTNNSSCTITAPPTQPASSLEFVFSELPANGSVSAVSICLSLWQGSQILTVGNPDPEIGNSPTT